MSMPTPPVTPVLPGFDLHSPERQLIEMTMAHSDLNAMIDEITRFTPSQQDDLRLRRMKKRRLTLQDTIGTLQSRLAPEEPS